MNSKIYNQLKRNLSNQPILLEFLKNQIHMELLINYLHEPTYTNKKNVDEAFKKYFLELRFTAYMSSLIHFTSIDFDKKRRKEKKRSILFPENDPNSPFPYIGTEDQYMEESQVSSFESIISSLPLHKAILKLTETEKKVLLDAYVFNKSDTEIAKNKGVSQQAISKTRTKALNKLKSYLTNGEV
ncbi:sigma-70 family RNA polymerase sigma factor [Paenibacillus glucanolyticus]|uniref:RNA polymerase sigma-70 region 4 domain-containing protein n=2 Tax=Paenibacillus glucanolyticus TaxID=59843 RepID=A0A163GJT1_9BACL|nr:sigma-70 family RNA polymerase sigma factor [Paenibacillus glucanolyticus]KZS45011.1 hypothetical protein AWU65_03250 [Paenibacillus glucanolyticus]OMF66752.1 hypothetical protein BK142_29465 [Paenibacillus glucanolyticus]